MKMEPCGDDLTPSTANIVYVEWEDIQSHEDWNEESEANTTCTLKSIGWLIEDDDRKLVIASTYDHENERWANKFAIGKLPPVVTELTIVERDRFQVRVTNRVTGYVPRIDEPTEAERRAVNPNKTERDQFHTTVATAHEIPGQP
jgi:hypothetical protein